MKKRKRLKISVFIMPFILMVILSGCGANKSAGAEVSGIEDSENENQNTDSSSDDSVISSDGTSDGQSERVDNPDGGWTISEFDETGKKLSESVYDADGKQIQNIVYNTNGSMVNATEYEYNEAGEQDKYITYEYDKNGLLLKAMEYDSTGELNTTTFYYYHMDGRIESTIESSNKKDVEDKRVDYDYDINKNLKSTSEYVANKQVKYTIYKKDGSIIRYDTDFEYDDTSYRYKTYNADGRLYSEWEISLRGNIVKYISYYYDSNTSEIAGYTVDEYDSSGNIINTSYFGIDANSELLNPILIQQKETDHFIFYSTDWDIDVLDDLGEVLEGCYGKITSDLGKVPTDKTKVYIYPNIKVYHKAIGRPNDPDWSIGQGGDGCFYLLSPLNPGPEHTYEDMFINAIHEFTHVVDGLFNRSYQSSYLSEGIATYEAGQTSGCYNQVRNDIAANTLPSLKELEGWNSYVNMSSTDSARAYAYGYVYIKFVVETSGFDTVISLLEGKSQTEAFGIGQEELNEKWMEFLASYVD